MPTTITFDAVPNGGFQEHVEGGFRFSTGTNAPDAFHGGVSDLGTGGHIFMLYTTDVAIVQRLDESAFGVQSVDLDGFRWVPGEFDEQGDPVPGSTVVTINFIGYTQSGIVAWSYETDGDAGFQTVPLPSDFSGGLYAFQWSAQGGSGLVLFDNLVTQQNQAPTAFDFSGSGLANAPYHSDQLVATDPDGQTLSFVPVGTLPAGVTLDPDGTFYVEPLPSDEELPVGDSRTVTFEYRAFDGEAYSEIQTVSFTLHGVTALGEEILGNNKPNTLTGSGGGDTISGHQNNDILSGLGGNDVLYGGNDADVLDGGRGADRLYGDNGKDTLIGGAGNDTLTGGHGPDWFVFSQSSDDDVITDFDPKQDTLFFDAAVFAANSTFQGVMDNHVQQVGADVVITYVGVDHQSHTITLLNVSMASLKANDFLFG